MTDEEVRESQSVVTVDRVKVGEERKTVHNGDGTAVSERSSKDSTRSSDDSDRDDDSESGEERYDLCGTDGTVDISGNIDRNAVSSNTSRSMRKGKKKKS